MLNASTISISNDTIAVRDQTDERNVHLLDAMSGKPLNDGKPLTHRQEIAEIALDQVGLPNSRQLAIVDKNRDLFLVKVRRFGHAGGGGGGGQPGQTSGKIGAMVHSLKWNANCNMLAAIQDARFTTFVYPSVVFVDKSLLQRTILEKDAAEFGKNPTIVSFTSSQVGNGKRRNHFEKCVLHVCVRALGIYSTIGYCVREWRLTFLYCTYIAHPHSSLGVHPQGRRVVGDHRFASIRFAALGAWPVESVG